MQDLCSTYSCRIAAQTEDDDISMPKEEPKSSQHTTATSKPSLLSGVLKLLTGRTVALGVAFVAAPVLTRLYGPEDFGILQIFLSLAVVIAVIACLGYELSIPLARANREAAASFILCVIFILTFTLITLALVSNLRTDIAQIFQAPKLEVFLWLLPLAVFQAGLVKALTYWAARQGEFGTLAWSGLSTALGVQIVPIVWAYVFGSTVDGLFVGYFVGTAAGLLLLLLLSGRSLTFATREANLDAATLFSVAKAHKKFPLFSTWSGLLNILSRELPPMLLGFYFSTTVVGYYALGQRLISLPLSLLGESVTQVIFPRGAREYTETGTISPIVSKLFKKLVQIGVFPMIAISLFGGKVFEFVFGPQWIEAGVYAQILAIWYLFAFLSSPLTVVFSILNRQEIELKINVVIFLGRAASLVIGGIFWSPRVALSLFVAASVVTVIMSIVSKLKLAKVSVLWASKTILNYVMISLLILLPVRFMSSLTESLVLLVAQVILAVMLYIVVLCKVDPTFKTFVTHFRETSKQGNVL